MTEAAPEISVIIVSWNVRDFLRKCLASVYRFTEGVTFEVFVVDNHSADGSAEMVRSEFPQVRLIENAENRGFARANNQAIREASGRFVLLLNPDTEVTGNALQAMAAFMAAHADAAGMGCRLVYGDGSLQRSCRRFPTVVTDFFESLYLDFRYPDNPFLDRYRLGGWGHDTVRAVDQPAGACLLFRGEALRRAGYFDERYFMFFEEVDLCYRVNRRVGRIYFDPHTTVIHYGNQSTRQLPARNLGFYCRSKLLFFRKHYGAPAVVLLYVSLFARTVIDVIVFPLAHLLARRPRTLRAAYLVGYLKTAWGAYAGYIVDLMRSLIHAYRRA